MTGFFIMSRGCNFLNDAPIAGLMMAGSINERESSLDLDLDLDMLRLNQRAAAAAASWKCSTIGPKDNIGKKVRAPTNKMVPVSRATNRPPSTGKLEGPGGLRFFFAMLPAMASTATIGKKRPNSMLMASVSE